MSRRIIRKKENKIYKFFNNASNGLKLRISILRNDVPNVEKLFTNPEVQEKNSKLFTKVINVVKAHPKSLANIMKNTKESIRKENSDIFINAIDFLEEYPAEVHSIYSKLSQEEKDNSKLIGKMVNNIGENEQYLVQVWYGISPDKRNSYMDLFRKILTSSEDKSQLINVWHSGGSQMQLKCEDLFPSLIERTEYNEFMWSYSDESIKDKYSHYIPEIIQRMHSNRIIQFWNTIPNKTQESVILDVMERIPNFTYTLIRETDDGIIQRKIANMMIRAAEMKIEGKVDIINDIYLSLEYKEKFLIDSVSDILKGLKDHPKALSYMWQDLRQRLGDKVQIDNSEIFPEIVESVKADSETLSYIINNTSPKVINDNVNILPELIKKLKDQPESIIYINYIIKNNGKELNDEQENLVNEAKLTVLEKELLAYSNRTERNWDPYSSKLRNIVSYWNDNENVQRMKPELFKSLIEEFGQIKNTGILHDCLKKTNIDVQRKNAELFPQLFPDLVKNGHWIGLHPQMQEMYSDLFIGIIKNEDIERIENIIRHTNASVYKNNIEKIIQDFRENGKKDRAFIIYKYINAEIQGNIIKNIIKLVKETTDDVATVWEYTDKKVQKEKIEEVIDQEKENLMVVVLVWKYTDKEVQKEKIEENPKLLSKVIDQVKENSLAVEGVWTNTDNEVQKKALEENPKLLSKVIDRVKESQYLAGVWANTDKDVQKENIEEVIKQVIENLDDVATVWKYTDEKVQKEKVEEVIKEVIELVKENLDAVARVWANTDKKVQKEKVEEVIELVKENSLAVATVW